VFDTGDGHDLRRTVGLRLLDRLAAKVGIGGKRCKQVTVHPPCLVDRRGLQSRRGQRREIGGWLHQRRGRRRAAGRAGYRRTVVVCAPGAKSAIAAHTAMRTIQEIR